MVFLDHLQQTKSPTPDEESFDNQSMRLGVGEGRVLWGLLDTGHRVIKGANRRRSPEAEKDREQSIVGLKSYRENNSSSVYRWLREEKNRITKRSRYLGNLLLRIVA